MRATLRYPVAFAVVILSAIANQFVYVLTPLYLKQIVDVLAQNTPRAETMQLLWYLLGMYAIFELVGWALMRARNFMVNYVENRVMRDLANDALANMLKHSQDFFSDQFAGSLTRRVTRFYRVYEQVFEITVKNFLPLIVYVCGAVWMLYAKNPLFGIALGVWTVLFVGFQYLLTQWRQSLRVKRVAADTKVTGILSDVIGNYSAVNLYSASGYEKKVFAEAIEQWRQATLRSWDSNQIIQAVQGFLCIIIEFVLMGGTIYYWNLGLATVGDLVFVQTYVLGLINGVWGVGNSMQQLYDVFADADEMVAIMEEVPTVQDKPGAATLDIDAGSIVFSNVHFDYQDERNILEDLNLHIKGGEKVAFIGASGAGKSTIIKLLLRQYDVRDGSITIDRQDIRDVTQDSLHEAIAFVPQEPVLFHRTLRENIVYGRRSASDEQMIAAAEAAHCHEFIAALPEGYDTYVGERGVKLSGGERQRVAIARAILKDAPILILDEATSSLDSESEALIQDALTKLMEGKTVIAIAHRLSTIMKMDRIIVMENGKAVISGTHDELLAHESNLYKKLWEIQAGGFITKAE